MKPLEIKKKAGIFYYKNNSKNITNNILEDVFNSNTTNFLVD
jgi:hypothetical protein